MFMRQKKRYRTFVYVALVATLCLLIIALLWPKEAPFEEKGIEAGAEVGEAEKTDDSAEKNSSQDGSRESSGNEGKIDNNENPEESGSNGIQEEESGIGSDIMSYYVVRKSGSLISVFFNDGKGNEVKLEDTEILYELLTPEDQLAFDEGIKASSQEELSALLQDFES